jgi:hypothetical protein
MIANVFSILAIFATAVLASPYDTAPANLVELARRDTGQVVVSCAAPGVRGCVCPLDLNGDNGVLINVFPVSLRISVVRHSTYKVGRILRATNARTRVVLAPGPTSQVPCRTPGRPTARPSPPAHPPAVFAQSTTTTTPVSSSTSSRATSAHTHLVLALGTT